MQQGMRAWRATGNKDIDRDYRIHPANRRVVSTKHSFANAARPDRNHKLRFGRGAISLQQSNFHIARHRTGNEEHIGVARRGNKMNAHAFKIVDWII